TVKRGSAGWHLMLHPLLAAVFVGEMALVGGGDPGRQLIEVIRTADKVTRYAVEPISRIGAMAGRKNCAAVFNRNSDYLAPFSGSLQFIAHCRLQQPARRGPRTGASQESRIGIGHAGHGGAGGAVPPFIPYDPAGRGCRTR